MNVKSLIPIDQGFFLTGKISTKREITNSKFKNEAIILEGFNLQK
jgi:hypothetical protein